MTGPEPVEARSMNGEVGHLLPWQGAVDLLSSDSSVWITSVRPSGRPHVMPVLAAWLDGRICFSTSHASQQTRNLTETPACVVAVRDDQVELVVEGQAERIDDEAELQRVADRYAEQHGWQVEVRNGGFESDQKAPTAGEMPFIVFAIRPTTAFALPVDGSFIPVRWQF